MVESNNIFCMFFFTLNKKFERNKNKFLKLLFYLLLKYKKENINYF